MNIVNMKALTNAQISQAAKILSDSLPLGWANINEALLEIQERLIPENTLLAAEQNGEILGWGGILPSYDGKVFELHPLAVREDLRGKNIGSYIITALESAAKEQGGLTIWLGADDEIENGETSLANVDLFNDLPSKIQNFEAGKHQSAFYLKKGYKIIGVMPNASGVGKPDIYLGKKL